MAATVFSPDSAYREMLLDFRADIFRRVSVVMAMFCLVAAYILIFATTTPPHYLILFLFAFSGFVLFTRLVARTHPVAARHAFVLSLYLALGAAMMLVPESWLPFLIFPVLFVSELLSARLTPFMGGLFFVFAYLLTISGYTAYPLQPLALFLVLMLVVTNRGMQAVYTILHWYRSTYEQSDDLLREARDRRAQVAGTLKSLEAAYDTQHRLQTQLMHARQQADDARRMKERFASNISHELRTPLNIILGFSEVMHLTPEVYGDFFFPPKLQRDIYQIHRNSRHLLEMIDDILDLSHVELSQFSLSFERTDLAPFLNDTVEMVRHLFANSIVEFTVKIADDLPAVEIDRTRMRQVIINLINNAQRFTTRGSVMFCVEMRDHHVVMQVIDTGIGIAQERQSLIFEEFYQVDYSLSRMHGGAGLGLAITRRFVEAHGGRLTLESAQGQGSTFTITLPLPRANQTVTLPREPDAAPMLKTAPESLWLVVDADPQVGKLITRHTQGKHIVQIASTKEIDAAIRQHSPQGVIVNHPPDEPTPDYGDLPVPVVVCSLPSTSHLVSRLGVDSCLAKPVRPQEVVELFGRYAGMRRVLVVDDDMGVVQLVQRSIDIHYPTLDVTRAYNGRQALDMMRSNPPDLVLLDLVMPDMDGFAVIEAMQSDSTLINVPVVLLTATKYVESDEETRGALVLSQHGGLRPMSVLKLLDSIIETVEPTR